MLLFNYRGLPLHSVFIDWRTAKDQIEAMRGELLSIGVSQLIGRVENHGPCALSWGIQAVILISIIRSSSITGR